jgi:hypothetical protein
VLWQTPNVASPADATDLAGLAVPPRSALILARDA